VAGVVGGVVHGLDVRKAGEVHQAQAQQACANGNDDALAEGDGGGKAVWLGAFLFAVVVSSGLSAPGKRGQPLREARPGVQQRPPTAGLS